MSHIWLGPAGLFEPWSPINNHRSIQTSGTKDLRNDPCLAKTLLELGIYIRLCVVLSESAASLRQARPRFSSPRMIFLCSFEVCSLNLHPSNSYFQKQSEFLVL
jgi:hypothetical protein